MPTKNSDDREVFAGRTRSGKPVQEPARLVVGLGASAGGLEALEEFFTHLPADSGLAFIVVTHQQPGRNSLLPELLGRAAKIPVVEATDGTMLRPDHVYVSPPGHDLEISVSRLRLKALETTHGVHLPIDCFFRSLAKDRQERAVCIVLSGTGTDGTTGLKAIKAELGMAMVQEPQSASFAGMPSAAISTGLADYVLSPAEMPQQLIAYAQGPTLGSPAAVVETPVVQAESMQEIFRLLRERTGHDFSAYKSSTIQRRVQRRMNVHRIETPSRYIQFLRKNPHEIDTLFKELLISVTSFFRDSAAWDALAAGPLPELLRSRPTNATLRAWVPGCATGEEVYSLAILLRECMDEINRPFDIKIFGTDLDSAAIEMARNRHYPAGIALDGMSGRLKRHLVRDDGSYCVSQEIREMTIFAPHNAIKDPPFTKLDILCCRNLFIYLSTDLQTQLLSVFHYALNPGGLLFLGPSETIGQATDRFETLDKKWKIFRRNESAAGRLVKIPPSPRRSEPRSDSDEDASAVGQAPSDRVSPSRTHSVERAIERFMLARFCPPSVVVDERGEVVHVHGHTGMYLEPAEGQPRMNVLEMTREGLKLELASALRQASTKDEEVRRENVRVKTNGDEAHVNLTVTKIAHSEAVRGLFLVSFQHVPPPQADRSPPVATTESGHTEQLEREVEQLKRAYELAMDETQTANEELKSGNEELQSMNEELQSTNEELETSKEELQSLNEELTTVNGELQSKVEELSHAYDDMQNLLNSTDIATLFLDNELNINRFTEPVKGLINLRQSDVGRPIWELTTNLQSNQLVEDCREALKTLKHTEREVARADGVWYMMRVLPYRTTRNVIDGVVITFMSIDQLKQAQKSAQWRSYFESLFNTMRHPLVALDKDLRVVSANNLFCQTFGITPEKTDGKRIYEVGDNEWDIPELRELLEEILPRETSFDDFKVEHNFRNLGQRTFILNARCVVPETGAPETILLAMEDATEKSH